MVILIKIVKRRQLKLDPCMPNMYSHFSPRSWCHRQRIEWCNLSAASSENDLRIRLLSASDLKNFSSIFCLARSSLTDTEIEHFVKRHLIKGAAAARVKSDAQDKQQPSRPKELDPIYAEEIYTHAPPHSLCKGLMQQQRGSPWGSTIIKSYSLCWPSSGAWRAHWRSEIMTIQFFTVRDGHSKSWLCIIVSNL